MSKVLEKVTNYFCQRERGWVLSLFVVVCLVYLPFLGSPFVFDDENFFHTLAIKHFAQSQSQFQFSLRWLPYATLGWIYAVVGDELTHLYHLGSMLLHAANVIVLFYFLRQLINGVAPDNSESGLTTRGAWFGALIFAVHPVAVYAAGYAIQFSILMATLFALLMQLAYLRGLLTGQTRWLWLAVLAYFLASLSKEHSVLLPAVLAALSILLRSENRADKTALWATWAGFFAVGVWVVLLSRGVIGTLYEMGVNPMFEQHMLAGESFLHLRSVLTQAGLFFKYLLLWLVPNPAWMSVDMREHFITGLSEWQGWAGGLAFIAYGMLAFRLLLRGGIKGLAGFALLYPWLLFWVEFSSIRVQEVFVLYRSYLWMPGMLLLIPLLQLKWPARRTWAVLGLVALILVPLAVNRLGVFSNDYRLWNDAAKLLHSGQEEGADRIYYNRARAAAYAGKWQAAAEDYERVVAIRPNVALMRYGLGVSYFNLKRYPDALGQFDAAIKLNPEYAEVYYNKGMTLKMLHENESAMQQIEKSCELKYAMGCFVAQWYKRR